MKALMQYFYDHTWPIVAICYLLASVPYFFFATAWYTLEYFSAFIGTYLFAVPVVIALIPGMALMTIPDHQRSKIHWTLVLPLVSSLGVCFWLLTRPKVS